MRNKKLALLMVSLVSCVAVGAITIGLASQIKNEYLNAESVANVVTIDVNDPDRKMDKGSGNICYTSALGNEFNFYYEGVTLYEGKYLVDGTLRNTTPLNGIYKVTINATKTQTVHILYGQESSYENEDVFELKEGANNLDFESTAPALLTFSPGSTFEFYSINIYYSCVAPKKEKEIERLEVNRLGAFNIYENDLFAVEGSALNEISLDNTWIQTTDHRGYSIDMSKVSDLSITYNDELLVSSTVVVKGINSVSISFYLDGWHFYSKNTKLIGYEGINTTIVGLSLQENSFLIQSNDDMPENFKLSVRYKLELIDSDEKTVSSLNGTVYGITIVNEMILKIDEHPFSERGKHSVKIQYQGYANTIEYTVYDPDYCNIRTIYYPGSIEIPAGSTKAEFLELIKDVDFYINYYNYDESLPETTKLTESNFPTLDDDTFNGGLNYVEVDIVYDTYEGTIYFNIGQSKGNLIKTYTNDEGILVLGYMTVVAIKIYDNGVAELITKGSTEGELYQYTLEGTTLSISFSGVLLKFTVDDTNDTFDEYQSTAQLIRSFKVDFSAFPGAGSDLYDGNQYDDGTIEFIIYGSSMNCAYTEDPSNDHIVYFNFSGKDCVGTFNDDYSVLVVSFAS